MNFSLAGVKTQAGGRRTFAGMPLNRRDLTRLWAGGYGGFALVCLAAGVPVLSLALQETGLDATVLLAVGGAVLLVALVRTWGRRLPRALLLGPALVGAATLAPYGVLGLGYVVAGALGIVDFPRGDFPTVGDALLVASIGLTASLGWASHSASPPTPTGSVALQGDRSPSAGGAARPSPRARCWYEH